MMSISSSKRSLLVFLAGLNALLAAALFASAYSLPAALAQARGGRGGLVSVTAKAPGQTFDVLYVLDSQDQKLWAFYPTGNATRPELKPAAPRDLKADFGR